MITAELGTTYPSEGGMYDWVKRAFGPKWAGRVAWNYWINFPLWISSLAVALTDVVANIFGIELSVVAILVLQLAYIALVSFLGTMRIGENKTVVNIGTAFKILFMVGLGILGIYVFIKTGHSANPIKSVSDLLPTTDLAGLSFISVIIFNFLGFEVVATFTDDMENPKIEIPKALIVGGTLMALFYILPATAVNIAMPVEDAAVAGLTDSFAIFLTMLGFSESVIRVIVIIVGLMFIYTMVANIASWSFGVNAVAKYAADDGSMPKMFKPVNKEGVPYKAAIINGIVAAVICILGIVAGEISEDFSASFGLFFSLSWITLLVGYIPMFLAFLKLRRTDPKATRPYKMPGGKVWVTAYTLIAFVLIVAGVLFTIFGDFTLEYIVDSIPLILGVIASFTIEEVLVARIGKSKYGCFISFFLAIIFALVYLLKLVPELELIWIVGAIGAFIVGLVHFFVAKKQIKKA
jgi:amino acid transporter